MSEGAERGWAAVRAEVPDGFAHPQLPRRYLPEGSMDKIYPRTSTNGTRLHHYTGHDH
ncbi:hypothetical protein NKH18_01825 [Streptomyces sp. M10(2022)]